jgi:hypothetical protein
LDLVASSQTAQPERIGLPPLILDFSVLLSPFGPLMVQRLSGQTSVWLPRGLPMLLEQATEFGAEESPADGDAFAEILSTIGIWQQCWPELVQRPGVHWFGDALDDSHAPKGEPAALLDRLDALIAALDRRVQGEEASGPESPLDRLMHAGCRDALALAGMFREGPSIVLSALRDGETEPWICRSLAHFKLTGHRIVDARLRDVLVLNLLTGLAAAGIAPLLGSGSLKLAALQLATAGSAVPLPLPRPVPGGFRTIEAEIDPLALSFEEEDIEPFWDHVAAIWHDLS